MKVRGLIQRGMILWGVSFSLAMPMKGMASENDITILKTLIKEFSDGRISSSHSHLLAKVIYHESQKHKIDPLLVLAVIHEESSFRTRAVSPVGARGLMQIMPATGREIASTLQLRSYRHQDLFDPVRNVRMGIYYLKYLKKKFQNNKLLFLTAYNLGPNRLAALRKEVPDSQLRFRYARRVLTVYEAFKESYQGWRQLLARAR
ncbi:MAG: lytic transglycosylase domain-containing protein [Deltaproteobacteria bacterium]|nr:lytic transglycosylase domain-containing protein [Deltaproteobacteria bacterium]